MIQSLINFRLITAFLYLSDTEFEVPHDDMVLFIQEPKDDTDFKMEQRSKGGLQAFHIIWFWTDNENQV
jgi:hypothetical protein